MDITIDLFNKICRVCLCQSANMKCLLTKTEEDRSLVDMFCYVGDIEMNLDDMLPKQVCNDCEVLLKKVDAFKRLCITSDSQLKKIYDEYIKLNNFQEKKPIRDETDSKSKLLLIEFPIASDGFENDIKTVKLNNYLFTDTEVSSKIENSTNKADVKIEFDNELDSLENDFDDEISQPESSYNTDLIYCQCGLVLTDPQTYKFHLSITNCDKIRKPKRKWVKSETEQEIICQRCDKHFKNPTVWKKHYLTNCDEAVTPENNKDFINYQCSICSAKYRSKKTLASHIRRLHKAPTSYKCERCNREFKHKAFLDKHIVSVHINDQVTCEYCNKQCLTQEDLEKHREEHIEKKHQCTTCKKVFTMACTLKEHLRTHTGEKPFLCSFCGKGFSQKHNLQQHVMRHQGNKPFKCKSCEKRFVSKGELEAHTRKHSGAHPFICDDCGNGFTTSSSLFKHRRIHTVWQPYVGCSVAVCGLERVETCRGNTACEMQGERPYKCDFCPMRFIASGTLKNHRRTHTGERPYQCSHCEKAFVQRNDLVSHIRCHTGERPYSCDHCGQGFRKATGLKAHLKVHGKRDDAFRTGGV